jgi:uncharacterized repeat protein (TIGR01451 family)
MLSTFTVANSDDSGPGSLRQAIIAANNLAGLDTIEFAIPGTGPYTIQPLSGLPSIDDPVILDGTTQLGFADHPIIELDGSQVATEVGLSIGAGGSTLRGLVINRFAVGILLSGGGGNLVEGNYIGSDLTGMVSLGNAFNGVSIVSSSANVIGGTTAAARNVIVGNGQDGIDVNGTGNTIEGNYIGLGADGATALGNARNGIHFLNSQNTIGGTTPGAGNVISGNGRHGIHDEDGSAIIIQGNFIGTDATGLIAVGNKGDGVKTEPGGDVIGGTDPGAGNLISGNGQAGIEMRSSLVQGNKIGTNINGDAALGNAGDGVLDHGQDTTIGGADKGSGNLISGNGGDGIVLESDRNTVMSNQIGVAADGTTALGNAGSGVVVSGQGNIIGGRATREGNLISGNGVHGVFLSSGLASDNLVLGNRIGTDADGKAALGNSGSGIWIEGADNTIGGPLAGCGNLISGNGPQHQGSGVIAGGVVISGGFATGNVLQGNDIGTDVTGTMAVPNFPAGVDIVDAPNSLIGGTDPGDGNVISANAGTGLNLEGAAEGTLIEGNLIGTDRAGTAALGNRGDGVGIDSNRITVGGMIPGARNVISGNGEGIAIGTTTSSVIGIVVQGNLIGTQIDGNSPLGNTGAGIAVLEGGFLTDSNPNVRIGAAMDSGLTPESAGTVANTIAFNRTGIATAPFTFGLTYLANSIYANSGLGIDIVPDGVDPNDNGDGTGFGNKTQNYPELTSAHSDGPSTTVVGTLNSTPNASFRVEFFANDKADETRYGEGQKYLGAIKVATGADGNAEFVTTLESVPTGEFITATATRPGYNTSEFSQVVEVNPPNTAADLSVTVTSAPDPVVVGQHLIYTITVTNHGPDPATDVGLIDQLPIQAFNFRSASGGGTFFPETDTVVFALGTIAGGDSVTNTIDVGISGTPNFTNTPGMITDSVSLTANETDPNLGNDSASVSTLVSPTPADMAVTMMGSSDPVTQGDELTYTITVSMFGQSGSGVVVKDTLPSGVTFVSASAGSSESGGVVTYLIGVLLGGNTRTLTIVVRPTTAGTITNTAVITANAPDPDPTDNKATLTTTVSTPASGPGVSAATTNPNEQAVRPRGGPSGMTQSLSLTFSEALDPARAVDLQNYHLFALGRAGMFGTSTGREIPLRSATYDPATHAVTLTPRRRIPAGRFFEVKVDGTSGHGVADPTGRLIDGNGDGRAGGDYETVLARGKSLRYRERDRDLVVLRLSRGGVLELAQRADGTIQQLSLVGAIPGRSELHGIVLRSRNGDGKTTIGGITGPSGVRNLLKSTRFIVG